MLYLFCVHELLEWERATYSCVLVSNGRELHKNACGNRKTQFPLYSLFLFDSSEYCSSILSLPYLFMLYVKFFGSVPATFWIMHILWRQTFLGSPTQGANENIPGYSSLPVLPLGSSFLCLFLVVTGVLKTRVGISNLILSPQGVHLLNERTQHWTGYIISLVNSWFHIILVFDQKF